jgi:hypothetical protein
MTGKSKETGIWRRDTGGWKGKSPVIAFSVNRLLFTVDAFDFVILRSIAIEGSALAVRR